MTKEETQPSRTSKELSPPRSQRTGITGTPSRRRLLHILGAGGAAGLAGCFAGGDGGEGEDGSDDGSADGSGGDGMDEKELQESAAIGFHSTQGTITGDYYENVYAGVTPYYTNIFEPLIWVTKDMEKDPWLATSWEATDEKTWVFTLREGVTFHNGKPMTADAVKFSFDERLTAEGGWAQNWLHLKPEGVKKIDDMTIEFTTTDPYPAFPGTIAHTWAAIQHPDKKENNDPIGTGPYKVEEIKKGQHVKVSAFEDYWNDTPITKKLTYRELTDPTTRLLSLKNHEVDVIYEPPRDKVDSLKKAAETNATTHPDAAAGYLKINTATSPTDNVKLRQALNYAVSQKLIVDSVLGGIGEPARGPIAPTIPWAAHDSLPAYGPDKEEAKTLVDESSYNDERIQIVVNTAEPTDGNLLAEVVQEEISSIGVTIEVRILEDAAFDEARRNGNGHLFLGEFGTKSVAADYLLYDWFYSKGCCSLWYDLGDEFDSLIEKGNQAKDPDVKKETYGKAQQMMMERAVILPLYYKKYAVATYKDVKGLDIYPIQTMVRWTSLKHLM